jgi:cytoskeletal protein RodZ
MRKFIVLAAVLMLAGCAQAPHQPSTSENTSSSASAQGMTSQSSTSSLVEAAISSDTTQSSDAAQGPATYSASVVQVGGMGSRTVTKTAWATDENANLNGDEFVSTDFNTPVDLMWVYCAQGYTLSNCQSSTSTVVPSDSGGCGVELPQLKNVVTFDCTLQQ